MLNQLACRLKKLTPGANIGSYLNNQPTDIFLQGFKQVISHLPQIVPDSIGSEVLERR